MHEQPNRPRDAGGHDVAPENEPTRLRPRIYVASLADYNSGRLHGQWLDAAREPAAIRADIAVMLAASTEPGAEEFAIHDYDEFGEWRVGEFDPVELVSRIAQGIDAHGPAFAAYAQLYEWEPERFDRFAAAYIGRFPSVEAYVEQLAEDLGYEAELERLPLALRQYVAIDYGAMARDLQAAGAVDVAVAATGGVWLFDAHR